MLRSMWSVTQFEQAARAAFARGDKETGAKLCCEAIAKYPENLGAAIVHARLLAAAGREAQGIRVVEQLAAKSGDVASWLVKGCVLQELGRVHEAIASFQTASTLDEGDGRTHRLLGAALEEAGEYQRALAILTRAAEVMPYDPEVWMRQASTLIAMDRFTAAAEALTTAARLEHDDALPLLRRALLYAGKIEDANDPNIYDDAGLGVAVERAVALGDLTLTVRYFRRQTAHPELTESVVTGLLDYVYAEMVEGVVSCAQRVVQFGLTPLTLLPEQDRGWVIHEHAWGDSHRRLRPEVTTAVELMVHTGLFHRRLDAELEECSLHDVADVDPAVFDGGPMVWHRTSKRVGTHSGWRLLSASRDSETTVEVGLGELAAWNLSVVRPLTLPVGWRVFLEDLKVRHIEDPEGNVR